MQDPTGERRSELFASVWAYLSDAAQKVRADGSEREAAYIEDVLTPFIEREGHAALVQEGRAHLAPLTQEEEPERIE